MLRTSPWRFLFAGTVLVALLATPGGAVQTSERYEFRAGTWIHLGIEHDGILVEDVKFDSPAKIRGLITRHDKPNRAVFVVRNVSSRKIDAGIAVALFDEGGELVAAGNTGVTPGLLQPGERHEFDIHFHGVYRDIDKAATFVVSLEF